MSSSSYFGDPRRDPVLLQHSGFEAICQMRLEEAAAQRKEMLQAEIERQEQRKRRRADLEARSARLRSVAREEAQKNARAKDLLVFMRHSRDEDGTTTFEGMEWLRKVPVSGGMNTVDEGLRRIRLSVEELAKSKHVKIEKPTGARWAVESWRITLL